MWSLLSQIMRDNLTRRISLSCSASKIITISGDCLSGWLSYRSWRSLAVQRSRTRNDHQNAGSGKCGPWCNQTWVLPCCQDWGARIHRQTIDRCRQRLRRESSISGGSRWWTLRRDRPKSWHAWDRRTRARSCMTERRDRDRAEYSKRLSRYRKS